MLPACSNVYSTRSEPSEMVTRRRSRLRACVGFAARFVNYETARSRRRVRSLRSRRRSRSEVPPQIPNCSLLLSAYSRHCARTGQPEHTARAAFDEPPRSGKKISGSTSEHRAALCHSTGCRSLVVIRCIPPAFLSRGPPITAPPRSAIRK